MSWLGQRLGRWLGDWTGSTDEVDPPEAAAGSWLGHRVGGWLGSWLGRTAGEAESSELLALSIESAEFFEKSRFVSDLFGVHIVHLVPGDIVVVKFNKGTDFYSNVSYVDNGGRIRSIEPIRRREVVPSRTVGRIISNNVQDKAIVIEFKHTSTEETRLRVTVPYSGISKLLKMVIDNTLSGDDIRSRAVAAFAAVEGAYFQENSKFVPVTIR